MTYTKKVVNLDGSETIEEFTAEEIKQREKEIAELAKYGELLKQKEDIRKSAIEKLAALGLTEEEIAAL